MYSFPAYRIQKTNPAFSLDKSTAWHVVDSHGNVVHYDFLRRDCRQWITDKLAEEAAELAARPSNGPALVAAAAAAGMFAAEPAAL